MAEEFAPVRNGVPASRCGISAAAMVLLSVTTACLAQEGGPDFWRVEGVKASDALNLRVDANPRSRVLARIPHDARSLKNLGCRGDLTFAQWQAMTPAQRDAAARARWCRVEFKGQTGWVAARFLREDSGRGR